MEALWIAPSYVSIEPAHPRDQRVTVGPERTVAAREDEVVAAPPITTAERVLVLDRRPGCWVGGPGGRAESGHGLPEEVSLQAFADGTRGRVDVERKPGHPVFRIVIVVAHPTGASRLEVDQLAVRVLHPAPAGEPDVRAACLHRVGPRRGAAVRAHDDRLAIRRCVERHVDQRRALEDLEVVQVVQHREVDIVDVTFPMTDQVDFLYRFEGPLP